MENTKAKKIKEMLGEQLFEEFYYEWVIVQEHGTPAEWEDDDDILLERAETFYAWHNDKEVIRAREIADILGHGIEIYRDTGYAIERTCHEYNGCISGMPEWYEYGNKYSLFHYSKKIIDEYWSEAFDAEITEDTEDDEFELDEECSRGR